MTITASSVKELREKTGAGMMDCKKALVETQGDFEAAVDWLKAKGLAAAAKKSGRIAAQGVTAICIKGNVGTAIEVNSETDFVSRNESFQSLVMQILPASLGQDTVEELNGITLSSGKKVLDTILDGIASIGENISLRRVASVRVKEGVVAGYVHNIVANNVGAISTLVALESKADKAKLEELGKQIAMHIAAAKPLYLHKSEVPAEIIEREKAIFIEQTKESGKPEEIALKMVEGRIRKFLEEISLLDQVFVMDGKTKISALLEEKSKEFGSVVELVSFVRFELGEGIEKEETNFAEEVASVVNKS